MLNKTEDKQLTYLTRQLFNLINEIYFDNKIPKLKTIVWTHELDPDLWALCYDGFSRLKLSVPLHAKSDPEELWDTLMHECSHIYLNSGGHGLRWRKLAAKLGIKLSEEIW